LNREVTSFIAIKLVLFMHTGRRTRTSTHAQRLTQVGTKLSFVQRTKEQRP